MPSREPQIEKTTGVEKYSDNLKNLLGIPILRGIEIASNNPIIQKFNPDVLQV